MGEAKAAKRHKTTRTNTNSPFLVDHLMSKPYLHFQEILTLGCESLGKLEKACPNRFLKRLCKISVFFPQDHACSPVVCSLLSARTRVSPGVPPDETGQSAHNITSNNFNFTMDAKAQTFDSMFQLVKKYNIPATFKFIFTFSSCKTMPLVHVVSEKLMLALTI